MSWIDESWQQAARDYHAGRKHGRRQGNSHMDFEREKLAAEIIPLGKHREQPEEIRPPAFSDDLPLWARRKRKDNIPQCHYGLRRGLSSHGSNRDIYGVIC